LHLVGCLYYLYKWCTVKQISDNEIYLLIKYTKSVLWRVAKPLYNVEDAWCLKVKEAYFFSGLSRINTCLTFRFEHSLAGNGSLRATEDFAFNKILFGQKYKENPRKKNRGYRILKNLYFI